MKGFGIALPLLLAACASSPAVEVAAPRPQPASLVRVPATAPLLGQNAAGLAALLGAPSATFAEGTARKLQFAGGGCVLDAYLNPPAAGGEAVVTHLDARRPSGEDYDAAACVAALRMR